MEPPAKRTKPSKPAGKPSRPVLTSTARLKVAPVSVARHFAAKKSKAKVRAAAKVKKRRAEVTALLSEALAEDPHMVTDEFDDTWDLTGAVDDVVLYYEIGAAVIQSDTWPNWNEGKEFRAMREESRR